MSIVQVVHRNIPNQKLVAEHLTAVLLKKTTGNGEDYLIGRVGKGSTHWVAKNGSLMSLIEAKIYFTEDAPDLPYGL